MKKQNPFDNSRPIDAWIWSNKPEIRITAEYILTLLQQKQKQRLKKYHLPRLKNHLKVILTDLLVVHKEDPKRYLAFSRNNSDYVPGGRFSKIFLNPKYIAFLSDFLAAENLIEFHKGFFFGDYGRVSRMKATQKLLRHFRKNREPGKGIILSRKPGIVLRDKEKRDISFDADTLEVKAMLRNVCRINKYLKTHDISLDTEKIPAKLLKEYMPEITDNNSKYIRIFNNSDFNQGGRFYCHWSQNVPRWFRKHILIDGKETIELDYSNLHIAMLYCLENIKPPAGDLYNIPGISTEHRRIIKKSFNIILNSDKKSDALKAIENERRDIEGETGIISPLPKYLYSRISETHSALKKYFCTGYGTFLQRLDSDLSERIFLQLNSQGICVLCIHDSFIVNTEYKDELYKSMRNHFYNRFNFFPSIK